MAYVLPESVLTQQVCSTCRKYLSFPPTKNYLNGEIKCGRCSNADDDGTVSSFETLARSMLFPCVNRFEGCSDILHYMDVKDHEKKCTGMVVNCPRCPSFRGSILYLIHHFKIKHFKELLTDSRLECSLEQEFSKYYLYCDGANDKIFLLIASWDKETFSLSCSTTIEKKHDRRVPQLTLLFFDNDEKDSALYVTNPKDCLDINYFLIDPSPDAFTFRVPRNVSNLICKLNFNLCAPVLRIKQFQCKAVEDYKTRSLRKMYLDKEFKKKYKVLDMAAFKVSSCGKKLVHGNYSLQIACDFCEIFFATSGFLKEIYYDSCGYVCGTCYSRGITQSLGNNRDPLTKLEDDGYHSLSFYCKFGCKKFCRSGELLAHEDQCSLNDKRELSEEDYVKQLFGKGIKGDKYIKENIILEPNKFKGKGRILIATRDCFKCIIDYEVDNKFSKCNFHVTHDYDPRTWYISVHKWEDQTYTEEYNDFSMKTKDYNGTSLFAVTLKEVQEELEIFYDT